VAAPAHTDPVSHVRAIWAAYASGGAEAVRELVGPEVDWVPLSGRRRAQDVQATVHGFETHGPCVLAHGSMRTFREGGFVDVQPSWVYFFRDGRLVHGVGYATREDALRAITEFRSAD
jgi:hypothetical protein